MKTTFIYILIDPVTQQVRYIGKTNNLKTRLREHCSSSCLVKRTHKNNWIKSLLNKGLKPLIETIDEINESEWQFWERHYISLYKSWEFNLTNSNEGGFGGTNPCEETRLKMSLQRKNKLKSQQHKENISKSLKGKNVWCKGNNNPSKREDVRQRKRLKMLGRKVSVETRLKLSQIRKGKTAHNKGKKGYLNLNTSKPVISIDKFTQEKKYFSSIKEAAKYYNINTYNISNCLAKRQKSCNNLCWVYDIKKQTTNTN